MYDAPQPPVLGSHVEMPYVTSWGAPPTPGAPEAHFRQFRIHIPLTAALRFAGAAHADLDRRLHAVLRLLEGKFGKIVWKVSM